MKTINSWKASPTHEQVESLRIDFDQPVPELDTEDPTGSHSWSVAHRAACQEEARLIVRELEQALPGSLFDALHAVLCERAASLLIVPYKPWPPLPGPEIEWSGADDLNLGLASLEADERKGWDGVVRWVLSLDGLKRSARHEPPEPGMVPKRRGDRWYWSRP